MLHNIKIRINPHLLSKMQVDTISIILITYLLVAFDLYALFAGGFLVGYVCPTTIVTRSGVHGNC